MKRILSSIDRFFFADVSAAGFGLMRIAWAGTAVTFLLGSMRDVVRYYSEVGLMPHELSYLVFRSTYRFTLLDTITEPHAVVVLWCILVTCLLCSMIGLWTRTMTITSALLLFSFHERNLQPLGGGDTVLRNVGFLLMIAPEISAFSVDRLRDQWKEYSRSGTLLRPLRTHIWPYRMLLWQIMIIYVTSVWDKLQGTMWHDGTVVEAGFHHTHFVRHSKEVMDSLSWISPYACFYTLIWETAWILLLVPAPLWHVLPLWMRRHSLKRWLIIGGLLFHWGIFVLMDVGVFPLALSGAYLGLLLDDDWEVLKNIANRKWKSSIIVLYDGWCSLCTRSIFFLQLMDPLKRIKPVDFRDTVLHSKHAPDVQEEDLDRAMHIKLPSGRYLKGFDAFRALSWYLPWTKLLTPLLFIPGIPPVGRMIYAKIAERRNRCAGGSCTHTS